MIILNLGCGTKTSDQCVNIDWSLYTVLKKNPVLRSMAWPFLNRVRRDRLSALSKNSVSHNLKNGIPFGNDTVDTVYHSHLMEHIDRCDIDLFLSEIHRVLKPAGIHRICVPDLEQLVSAYIRNYESCENSRVTISAHDDYVAAICEQCVRKESYATRNQPVIRRYLEKIFLGDARRRGETHQWMYDRFNMYSVLDEAGFRDIRVMSYNNSNIPDWKTIGLETKPDGTVYKKRSLYVECVK